MNDERTCGNVEQNTDVSYPFYYKKTYWNITRGLQKKKKEKKKEKTSKKKKKNQKNLNISFTLSFESTPTCRITTTD